MKNFFKKTITLTYLTIIIFGFFIPFNLSLAQNKKDIIILSTNSPTVTTNVPVTITATLDATNKESKIISFFTTGPGYSFSPKTCNMAAVQQGQIQSCSVTFGSLIDGTFWILANSDTNQTSEGVQVVVNSPYAVTVTPQQNTDTTYTPLAPIPGLGNSTCTNDKGETVDCIETNKEKIPCPFGNYLNIMIKIIIGIAAVLAMVMITMGGIEYMTSELISSKEAGKETITHAVLGLVIALGSYLILNTINPQLLNVCLNRLPTATIVVSPYDASINSYISKTSGNCSVITNGDCSVDNFKKLGLFKGKEDKASMICNIESSGIVNSKSNSDYCSVGQTTFSFGLFQINLLVHGDKIPSSVGNCLNLFTTSKGAEIGYGKSGYVVKDKKGNYTYDCKLKPDRGDDYAKCSAYLKTASGNFLVASKLFQSRGLGDWKLSDQNICSAAFQ